MNYNKQELLSIESALFDASIYVDTALEQLSSFARDYTMDTDAFSSLAFAASHDPRSIELRVHAISLILLQAKCELDAFVNPTSPQLQAYFAHASELQNIQNALSAPLKRTQIIPMRGESIILLFFRALPSRTAHTVCI